jgi:hypothetical protein
MFLRFLANKSPKLLEDGRRKTEVTGNEEFNDIFNLICLLLSMIKRNSVSSILATKSNGQVENPKNSEFWISSLTAFRQAYSVFREYFF